MRNERDIKSGAPESIDPETNPSGFFTKYSPGDGKEAGTSAQAFLSKYVPALEEPPPMSNRAQSEFTERESQSGRLVTEAERGSQRIQRRLNFVWPLLVLVALVPLVLGIWRAAHSRNTPGNASIAETSALPAFPDPQIGPSVNSRTTADGANLSFSQPPSPTRLIKLERQSNSPQPALFSALPTTETMLRRAREFEDRGMLERAEQEYNVIVAKFPSDQPSKLGLGRVQSLLLKRHADEAAHENRETGLKKYRSGEYATAAMYLSASVNDGLSDTATLYSLGMSFLKLGRNSEAGTVLDRCVAAKADYAPALVGLAEVERRRGSKDRAVLLLRRALELGGGAEFTPVRIKEMISVLAPETNATPIQPKPALMVSAVHQHAFLFSRCRGQLTIDDSVIRFTSYKPGHSFSVSGDALKGARAHGNLLSIDVNGRAYILTIDGFSAVDFLRARGH